MWENYIGKNHFTLGKGEFRKHILQRERHHSSYQSWVKEYEKRKHTNELKSKISLDSDSLNQDKFVKVDKVIENSGEIIDDSEDKKVFPHSANDITTDNSHENATDDITENKIGANISDLNIEEIKNLKNIVNSNDKEQAPGVKEKAKLKLDFWEIYLPKALNTTIGAGVYVKLIQLKKELGELVS